MSAPATTTDLLALIHKSGIADPDEFAEKLGDPAALPAVPSLSAAVLVQRGLLTKFQAKLLLTGRFRGFKLGPYVVQEHLGQGGMGAVYLAEHEALRRRVAVKVLTQPKGDQQGKLALERFLREARAAAALDHPNIVRVHDVSKQGDVHFLVLEYVEGQTLEQLTQAAGAVPPGKAVGLMAQAAAGLQHAFEKGFVHRDIKPANLMLTRDGTVKILDMGLARSLSGEGDKLTERMDEGAIVGTADFISPEQAMNAPKIDVRSDIYSLGATFFALVTGKPPFAGNTTQKLVQHQMKEPPTLDSIDRTVPPELAVVVAKMLAKKPEKRYQTPAEVITALAPWLTDDGATKIVAALSGSDLAGSLEMQNTLNELVQGGTTRIGKSKRLTGKKKPVGLWAGTAAAVLVAAGLVGWMTLGGSTAGTTGTQIAAVPPSRPATNPTPAATPTPNPARTQPVAAVVPAPAAATTALYKFDPAVIPECRFQLRGYTVTAGDKPALPDGYNMHCWKPDSTGEFVREVKDGRPVLGLAARDGDASAQFAVGLTTFAPDLAADRDITVAVEYMTRGTTGNVYLQNKSENYAGLGTVKFGDSAGEWRTAELKFRRPAGAAVQLAINCEKPSADGMVYVRSVAVFDPAARPSSRTNLFTLNAAAVPPFRLTMQGGNRVSGETPAVPAGVLLTCWKGETQGLFVGGPVDGVPAIGIASVVGPNSAEMAFEAERSTAPTMGLHLTQGQEYTLRVEYKTTGRADGQMYFQRLKKNAAGVKDICKEVLPNTAGEWRTAELKLVRKDEPVRFVVSNLSTGEQNVLYVRRVDLQTASTRIDTPEYVTYRFQASDVPPFENTKAGRNRMSGTAEAKAPNVLFVAWNPNTRTEWARREVDGVPAIAGRVLTPGGTASMAFDLEAPPAPLAAFVPGRKYIARVTYKADPQSDSSMYWQQYGGDRKTFTRVRLPDAATWQTVELEVVKSSDTLKVNIDSNGKDGFFYLREFSVVEAGGAAAAVPVAAYRLELGGQKPLAVRGGGAPKDDPTEDVQFVQTAMTGDGQMPAGWRCQPWDHDSEAEFLVTEKAGKPAFGMRNIRSGPRSEKAFTGMMFAPRVKLPGGRATVKMTYLTDADGLTAAQIKFKPTVPEPLKAWAVPGAEKLPGTAGQWLARTFEVDLQGATEGYFELHAFDPDPANGFYISGFEVLTPGASPSPPAVVTAPPTTTADGATLFALDMPAKAFRYTLMDGKADTPDAYRFFPAGVYVHCWKKESVAEVRGEPTDAGLAVGVTNLNDHLSSQLQFGLEDGIALKLKANQEYKVRLEYRTAGDAVGQVQTRGPGPTYTRTGGTDLPSTDGQWKTTEFTFRRSVQKADLIVENTVVGEGNTLFVRKLELIERVAAVSAASAAPPAEKPASMSTAVFDPLSVPAFDLRYADKRPTGPRPTLPPGFGMQAYRATTVGRMWTESIGGRPAFGMEAVSGEASLQLYFDTHPTGQPAAVTAGRKYAVRVEYMTRGDGAGDVVAQTHGTWTRVANTPLPPTGGKWQAAELRFEAGTDPLRLAVNATKVGSQHPLYLGRFELVPVD